LGGLTFLEENELEKAIVQAQDVVKRFGEVVAVDHVSIEVLAGEFFSILGPSGCGKTTLLRLIAGLEDPDSGAIYLGAKLINAIPPYRRDVNTVFQNYALFPHMNVHKNIAFGLKMKRVKKDEIDDKVSKALELVDLSGMGSRKPGQLSGGQQQRVALARALVNEPSVLLLDEPLGALDLKLRKEMQMELKSLQKRLGITFIYVTHDQEEALTMSDRIAVMCAGEIEQVGTPSQVYEEPKTEFVADFIGISNLFSGDLRSENDSILTLMTPDRLEIKTTTDATDLPRTATVIVRPEKIQISPHKPEEDVNFFRGRIEEIVYLGTVIQFIINLNDKKLVALEKNHSRGLQFEVNQEVFVSWDISSGVILSGR
jgi:spermidine/putrescine transport system ATP-binding protein